MELSKKEVLVPLNWYELDTICLALRIINGNRYNELEKKISNWSMKAKENK